jgi:hypothetical protein
MKTLVRIGIGMCCMVALSFGITMYRGQLMDASCYQQNQSNGKVWSQCVPTASTTAFAVHANGKVRMLDDAGNQKAMAALKEGDLKVDKRGDMPVTIDGWRQGNTIKVEGIRAPGSDVSVH